MSTRTQTHSGGWQCRQDDIEFKYPNDSQIKRTEADNDDEAEDEWPRTKATRDALSECLYTQRKKEHSTQERSLETALTLIGAELWSLRFHSDRSWLSKVSSPTLAFPIRSFSIESTGLDWTLAASRSVKLSCSRMRHAECGKRVAKAENYFIWTETIACQHLQRLGLNINEYIHSPSRDVCILIGKSNNILNNFLFLPLAFHKLGGDWGNQIDGISAV